MNPLRHIAMRGLCDPGNPPRCGVGIILAPFGRSLAELRGSRIDKGRPFEPPFAKLLLTKTQFLDQGVVALDVFLLEIGEQAATLVDHLQEATT